MGNFKEPIVRLKGEDVNFCVFRTDDEAIEKYLIWMNDEEILQKSTFSYNVHESPRL